MIIINILNRNVSINRNQITSKRIEISLKISKIYVTSNNILYNYTEKYVLKIKIHHIIHRFYYNLFLFLFINVIKNINSRLN